MKLKIRFFIQYLLLKLNFFPFNLIFKAVLFLCVSLITLCLKQNKKIRSIYLIRGFAKNEAVFGISDIDLMIIYTSGEDNLLTISQIKKTLSRLRIFIRFLAPNNEIGILSLESLREYGQDHYWYAWRMAEAPFTWKLLYGQDILKDLNKADSLETMYKSIVHELNQIWLMLIQHRCIEEKTPVFLQNYQNYKGITEILRIYLFLNRYPLPASRMEAILSMNDEDRSWQEIKSQLLACHERNFVHPPLDTTALLNFSQHLIVDIYQRIANLPSSVLCQEKVMFSDSIESKNILPPKHAKSINETLEEFKQKWSHEINNTLLVPQVEFKYDHHELENYYNRLKLALSLEFSDTPLSKLDQAELFPVYLVLKSDKQLPVELIDDLLGLIKKLHLKVEIYPYLLINSMALPLMKNYKQEIKPIKTPLTDPLFFYFCNQSTKTPLVSSISLNAAQRYLELLAPELSNAQLNKISKPGFLRLFLVAMRSQIFVKTYEKNRPFICIDYDDIFQWLNGQYPQEAPWLNRFKQEIQKHQMNEESNCPLFFNQALNLLQEKTDVPLSENKKLTASVIIITADRKNDIVECLDSLKLQHRIPDEVVIIDNGQHEFVDQAITPYIQKLNIKYFREAKRGIPIARNAGLKYATGDVLAFIDDDCIADPYWLENLVLPFQEDKTIGVVGGYLSGIGRTNKIVERYYDFTLLTKFGVHE